MGAYAQINIQLNYLPGTGFCCLSSPCSFLHFNVFNALVKLRPTEAENKTQDQHVCRWVTVHGTERWPVSHLGDSFRVGMWQARWKTLGHLSQQSSSPPFWQTAHQSSLGSSSGSAPFSDSGCDGGRRRWVLESDPETETDAGPFCCCWRGFDWSPVLLSGRLDPTLDCTCGRCQYGIYSYIQWGMQVRQVHKDTDQSWCCQSVTITSKCIAQLHRCFVKLHEGMHAVLPDLAYSVCWAILFKCWSQFMVWLERRSSEVCLCVALPDFNISKDFQSPLVLITAENVCWSHRCNLRSLITRTRKH